MLNKSTGSASRGTLFSRAVLVTLRVLKRFLGSLLTRGSFLETSPYEPSEDFRKRLYGRKPLSTFLWEVFGSLRPPDQPDHIGFCYLFGKIDLFANVLLFG